MRAILLRGSAVVTSRTWTTITNDECERWRRTTITNDERYTDRYIRLMRVRLMRDRLLCAISLLNDKRHSDWNVRVETHQSTCHVRSESSVVTRLAQVAVVARCVPRALILLTIEWP